VTDLTFSCVSRLSWLNPLVIDSNPVKRKMNRVLRHPRFSNPLTANHLSEPASCKTNEFCNRKSTFIGSAKLDCGQGQVAQAACLEFPIPISRLYSPLPAPCCLLKKSPQRTYKPGFVSDDSEEASPTIIPLWRRLLAVSSSLPGSRSEPDRLMLPVWPCTGWGLPSQASRPACWCALTAPFHPYRESCQPSALSRQPERLAES